MYNNNKQQINLQPNTTIIIIIYILYYNIVLIQFALYNLRSIKNTA